MSESRYHLSVLGKPGITDSAGHAVDLPIGKPLALFSFLALEIKFASRDELCEMFWPDSTRGRAQASLRQAVWLLRKVLGPEALPGEGDFLGPAGEHISTDVERVESLLSAGMVLEASELWRGDPFSELSLPDAPEWSRWTDEIRSRYEWRLEESLWVEGQSLRKAGDTKEALRWFRRGVAIRPYSPRCHVGLLECFLELGLLTEAEEALGRARGVFEDGLDEDLEASEARILNARRQKLEQKNLCDPALDRLPFVGRTSEFSVLTRLWQSAKNEEPQVVLISGVQGIGKTRLTREFLDFVKADEGGIVHWRAAMVEEDLEWGVASEVVKQLTRIPGAAGISDASTQALALLNPSSAQGAWTTPSSFLTAGFADSIDDLISAVSFEGPLAVVLDDLQWVDHRTRAVIAKVSRTKAPRSAMFLFALEVESSEIDRGRLTRDFGVEPSEMTVLNLAPLSEVDYREALAGRLDLAEDLDRVSSRFLKETSGNPLALEETLLSMRESGLITKGGSGKLRVSTAWMAEATVIERFDQRLFTERLRPLSPNAQVAAASLARFGIPASIPELHQETGLTTDELEQAVQELLSGGLLVWDSDDRLDLVHVAVREGAMALLPAPTSTWPRPRQLKRRAVMGLGVALLLGGVVSLLSGSSSPFSLERFGDGVLLLSTDDSLFLLRSPVSDYRWQSEGVEGTGPYGTSEGGRLILPDGKGHSVFTIRRDQWGEGVLTEVRSDGFRFDLSRLANPARLVGMSPEGSLLVLEEVIGDQVGPAIFRIFGIDRSTGDRLDLHESGSSVLSLDWSRHRLMIAALIGPANEPQGIQQYPGETLVLLTPEGDPVDSISLGQSRTAIWCGDGGGEILFTREEGGSPPSLWRLPVTGSPPRISFGVSEEIALRFPLANTSLACSPNGEGIAYLGLGRSGQQIVIEDLGTGDWQNVPWDGAPLSAESLEIRWASPEPLAIPLVRQTPD